MGQVVWISGMAAAAALVFAMAATTARSPEAVLPEQDILTVAPIDEAKTAYVSAEIATPEVFTLSGGSALATAAFGMAALHPETYNGDIVRDLIRAAPLTSGEKSRLKRQLYAADTGQADLSVALTDVRVALALE
ncbi:MAG: hypothetical protein OIF48_04100 [Silicimonas sp.]|nr:hypothetical protein [Silicimonas sp.]